MASASGFTTFNEAAGTIGDIQRHLYGSRRALHGLGFAAGLGVYVAIRTFWPLIPSEKVMALLHALSSGHGWAGTAANVAVGVLLDPAAMALIILFLGVLLWNYGESRLALRFARKMAAQAEAGGSWHTSLTIAAEGLTYQDGGVMTIAEWPNVVDVFRSGEYWIFLLIGRPIVLPRRFFASEAAERDFIGEALGYMSDAARERSKKAMKFVNAGKV